MDKVTCEPGVALDTGGHPGPAALAGGNLLSNVLDLQPGPWGEAWTGVSPGCLCNRHAWKQGNACQADPPQLGQLQADYPPNTVPLGSRKVLQKKESLHDTGIQLGQERRVPKGLKGLCWAVGTSMERLCHWASSCLPL